MGGHEQEQPRAGWLVRLENILENAHGVEIEGEESSIIIDRTKDQYADFKVEVRYSDNPEVREEHYELKKEIGLVCMRVTFPFSSPHIPNIVGFNFPEYLGPTEDVDIEIASMELEDDPAAQFEFNMKANILMDYVERTAKTAKMVVRDPRPVE